MATMKSERRRVGIVGYGSLGKYLAEAILNDEQIGKQLELCFVWNRTSDKITGIASEYILQNLDDFASRNADLIVEVAHPNITKQYGTRFVRAADYLIGSPTALADAALESALRSATGEPGNRFGVFIPSGALWGVQDIQKMASRNSLVGLTVTMKKAPHHLKLEPPLDAKVVEASNFPDQETVIFSGSVREVCPLAPNNVNTMAAAALVASNLGFDRVNARLIADPRLDRHIVEVIVEGPNGFRVVSERSNPAAKGAVTGQATYASFLSSILLAAHRGPGIHFC